MSCQILDVLNMLKYQANNAEDINAQCHPIFRPNEIGNFRSMTHHFEMHKACMRHKAQPNL